MYSQLQNVILVTYKGLDADFIGHTIRLKLLIENNTSDAKVFQIRDESINGYLCEGSFSLEVTAGMKANDDIAFYNLPDEVGITSKEEIKSIVLRLIYLMQTIYRIQRSILR